MERRGEQNEKQYYELTGWREWEKLQMIDSQTTILESGEERRQKRVRRDVLREEDEDGTSENRESDRGMHVFLMLIKEGKCKKAHSQE